MIFSMLHAEPEFNIDPPMVTVDESDGMVEICITTSSPLARSIVVTAVTGPKNGAANQATGTINLFKQAGFKLVQVRATIKSKAY